MARKTATASAGGRGRATATRSNGHGRGPDATTFPAEADLTPDVIGYGPDIPDERSLRLLGHLEALSGRRVLELGGGSGHNAVVLARHGARVITVDPSWSRLEKVRDAADGAEVKVELHQGDVAELAFVRAETIDAALAVYTFALVPDLDRVLRQVHRVLRREAPLVFSLPHPAFAMVDPQAEDPNRLARSYFDREPRPWSNDDGAGRLHHRTFGEVLTSLMRANFRVESVLEPEPTGDRVRSPFWSPAMRFVPSTLIIRARKEGL